MMKMTWTRTRSGSTRTMNRQMARTLWRLHRSRAAPQLTRLMTRWTCLMDIRSKVVIPSSSTTRKKFLKKRKGRKRTLLRLAYSPNSMVRLLQRLSSWDRKNPYPSRRHLKLGLRPYHRLLPQPSGAPCSPGPNFLLLTHPLNPLRSPMLPHAQAKMLQVPHLEPPSRQSRMLQLRRPQALTSTTRSRKRCQDRKLMANDQVANATAARSPVFLPWTGISRTQTTRTMSGPNGKRTTSGTLSRPTVRIAMAPVGRASSRGVSSIDIGLQYSAKALRPIAPHQLTHRDCLPPRTTQALPALPARRPRIAVVAQEPYISA